MSDDDHDTSSPQRTEGNHIDSMLTRPAADRVMSGPEALTTGRSPKSFQRIAPDPSMKLSPPRMTMPCSRTVARQTIPRSHRMTSSAENEAQPLSLISPCICNRTADANRVPGAMACSRYFLAAFGRCNNRAGSSTCLESGAEFHKSSSETCLSAIRINHSRPSVCARPNLFWRIALLHNATVPHLHNPVSVGSCLRIVRDHQDRLTETLIQIP